MEEALEAGLPMWSEVSAMSSLSLKCVLTDGLRRLLSSVYAKGSVATKWACYGTRIFLLPNHFSYLSSLAFIRSPITDSVWRTRFLEDDGVLWDTGSNILSMFDGRHITFGLKKKKIDARLISVGGQSREN